MFVFDVGQHFFLRRVLTTEPLNRSFLKKEWESKIRPVVVFDTRDYVLEELNRC